MTPDDVAAPLRALTGRDPVEWTPRTEGGYSRAGRWVVRWPDGGTAFVKAEAEPSEEHGLGTEHLVYSTVASPHLPRVHAYDPGPPRLLVTEDLSAARWGTPVTEDDTAAFAAAIDALAEVPAPAGLRSLARDDRWAAFVADPAPFVATGLADEDWALRHLPALADAEAAADPAGDALVHGDVWLQNWCRTERGIVLVDWAAAAAGERLAMRAFGEVAVRAAGGPAGRLCAGRPEWAAWMAGQTAYYLTRTPEEHPLVETERRESLAALRWACDELGLPHPEPAAALRDLGPWRP